MSSWDTIEGKYDLASIVAVVAIAAIVGIHLIVPEANLGTATRSRHKEETKLIEETAKLREDISITRGAIESKLWTSKPDEVGAEVMREIDAVAKSNNVTIQSFRPQRTATSDSIVRYPYSTVVQGSFLRMLSFVKGLQATGTKLAVTGVQLTSADGASDTVTANIAVAAFLESREEKTNGAK